MKGRGGTEDGEESGRAGALTREKSEIGWMEREIYKKV